MRRREFIALLGGVAAAAWPLAARAQQPAMPVVGYVWSSTASAHLEAALRLGLKEAGFVEGQNVAVEFHYADNRADRLSALIADLVRRPVNVIVGNLLPALTAKAAPRPCRSCLRPGPTQSGTASSPASTGRAATSPV